MFLVDLTGIGLMACGLSSEVSVVNASMRFPFSGPVNEKHNRFDEGACITL